MTAAKLLAGYRGEPAADVDALADAVCAVGDLLVEREEVVEVDVNPVLATDEGVVALNALVLLEGVSEMGEPFERVWTVRFSDTDPFGIVHYPRIGPGSLVTH